MPGFFKNTVGLEWGLDYNEIHTFKHIPFAGSFP
jgi:hypothetical protein